MTELIFNIFLRHLIKLNFTYNNTYYKLKMSHTHVSYDILWIISHFLPQHIEGNHEYIKIISKDLHNLKCVSKQCFKYFEEQYYIIKKYEKINFRCIEEINLNYSEKINTYFIQELLKKYFENNNNHDHNHNLKIEIFNFLHCIYNKPQIFEIFLSYLLEHNKTEYFINCCEPMYFDSMNTHKIFTHHAIYVIYTNNNITILDFLHEKNLLKYCGYKFLHYSELSRPEFVYKLKKYQYGLEFSN